MLSALLSSGEELAAGSGPAVVEDVSAWRYADSRPDHLDAGLHQALDRLQRS